MQTVYFHFQNKATLLKEALDMAAVGDDEPVALLERSWLAELTAEPDPVRVIELWTDHGREVYERVAPLLAVVRGTIGTVPYLAFLLSSAENYVVATVTLGCTPERWQRTTARLLAQGLLGDTPS